MAKQQVPHAQRIERVLATIKMLGGTVPEHHLMVHKPDGRRLYTITNLKCMSTRCFTWQQFEWFEEGVRAGVLSTGVKQ